MRNHLRQRYRTTWERISESPDRERLHFADARRIERWTRPGGRGDAGSLGMPQATDGESEDRSPHGRRDPAGGARPARSRSRGTRAAPRGRKRSGAALSWRAAAVDGRKRDELDIPTFLRMGSNRRRRRRLKLLDPSVSGSADGCSTAIIYPVRPGV